MVNLMFQMGLRTVRKTCLNTNAISFFQRANIHGIGHRYYSNESGDDSENGGKLIQLVVTSLRVDRVAASGLGIARR